MSQRTRSIALVIVVALVTIGLAVAVLTRGPAPIALPPPVEPVLPNLISEPLTDFLVGTDEETGAEALRFSATIANIGAGELRLEAQRSGASATDWQVAQWFQEPDGSRSGIATDASLVLGGHGHDHWHLAAGVSYRLFPAAEGEAPELTSHRKAGFCFFDQVRRPSADPVTSPASPLFPADGCGDASSTTVSMGMSPGWSDPYFWQLQDQSVVITGFADGRYRLTAAADPDGWLRESDDTDNDTWVILELGTQADGLRTVAVVESAVGP